VCLYLFCSPEALVRPIDTIYKVTDMDIANHTDLRPIELYGTDICVYVGLHQMADERRHAIAFTVFLFYVRKLFYVSVNFYINFCGKIILNYKVFVSAIWAAAL
jgi:hypothetical protein